MSSTNTNTNGNNNHHQQDYVEDRMPLLAQGPSAALPGSYQATTTTGTGGSVGSPVNDDLSSGNSSDSLDDGGHQTTVSQTFFHLFKGYIGPGMLSLPWAVSQVGITAGVIGVFTMSLWSSYNCWTVVRVKRYMDQTQQRAANANNKDDDDKVSDTGSSVTTNTNITYPDVGEWAYGKTFQKYVSACICTQQLAICTVFISFIGENLIAVLQAMPVNLGFWETHVGVMTMALPFCLSLSFIPSLKGLSPVMAAGTFLLGLTLGIMALVGVEEWHDRPETYPSFTLARAPLAFCAILYSYEGICLILPIESAMREPKYFAPTFVTAMGIVSVILAAFSALCVLAFGNVTNGSVTAFLMSKALDATPGDLGGNSARTQWLILAANTAISLSVLLTYPLQLFPAVELLGPSWSKVLGGNPIVKDDEEAENDLTGFDPLPALPEHDTFAEEVEEEDENNDKSVDGNDWLHKYEGDKDEVETPGMNLTIDTIKGTGVGDNDAEDAQSIRSFLSSAISLPNQMMPKMIMDGDSPQLRTLLVIMTYTIAVVVPNVQALISLAGALAGSSSALLIPPVLELAWLKHVDEVSGVHHHQSRPDPPGAPAPPPADSGVSSLTASPLIRPKTMGGSPLIRNPKTTMGSAAGATATGNTTTAAVAGGGAGGFRSTADKHHFHRQLAKTKCYVLFFFGFVFMLIGTYASIADIVAIYVGGGD